MNSPTYVYFVPKKGRRFLVGSFITREPPKWAQQPPDIATVFENTLGKPIHKTLRECESECYQWWIDARDRRLSGPKNGPHFDKHASGAKKTKTKMLADAGFVVPKNGNAGVRLFQTKFRPHRDSAWASDQEKVRAVIETFCRVDDLFELQLKEHKDSGVRTKAAAYTFVIDCFFRCGMTEGTIANELGVTPNAVKMMIREVRAVRAGKKKPGRGGRRAGAGRRAGREPKQSNAHRRHH